MSKIIQSTCISSFIHTVLSSTYSLSFTCVCPVCDYSSPSSFPLSGFTPSVVPDRQRRVAGRSAAWGFFRLRLLPCCWPWEIDFTAQAGPRDPSSYCCQPACPLTPCITQVTGRRSPRVPAQRPMCCHFVRPKVNYSHVLITANFIKL